MINVYNESLSLRYHHGSRITLTPSWHDKNIRCPNSKLYYVLDGEICVETEQGTYVARKGDAVLIPAGVKHSYHLTELERAEKYWFHFDMRLGQSSFFDSVKIPYIKKLGYTPAICNLLEAVVAPHQEHPSEKLSRASAMLSVVALYLADEKFIDVSPEENDTTDVVINYIGKNYAEKFTLNGLAKMAKLSPNYFTKKFKEKVGQPPLKYVNTLRIQQAKFLLEHTDKPINTVMEEVGFWDAAHFSKLFKLETGYSPSKFRFALFSKKDSTQKLSD